MKTLSKINEMPSLPTLKLNSKINTVKYNIIDYLYQDKMICIKSSNVEKHIKSLFEKTNPNYLKIKHGVYFFNETIPSIFNIKTEKVEDIYNEECPICFDKIEKDKEITTHCKHSYCIKCFNQLLTHQTKLKCALCREKININKISFNIKNRNFHGCKFKFLVQMLMLLNEKKEINKYIIMNYDWKDDFEKNFKKINFETKNIKYIIPGKCKLPVNKKNSYFIQYTNELNNFKKKEIEHIKELSKDNENYKILKTI